MEELIKEIEQAIELACDRVELMHESNRKRKSNGERTIYEDFHLGKAHGYRNGLTHAMQKIKKYIQQNKPTEPVT